MSKKSDPITYNHNIVELSEPPYYTAYPNPNIRQFIKKYGKLYDSIKDKYQKQPLAFDVSEGKNDGIYNIHSYHTKIPPKAIIPFILHYTEPGDVIFDGFCGSGMTGVAVQSCINSKLDSEKNIEKQESKIHYGVRKVILSDISPIATLISYNLNRKVDEKKNEETFLEIMKNLKNKVSWMYETDLENHNPEKAKIDYVVWSDIFSCPNCSHEFDLWSLMILKNTEEIKNKINCPKCKIELKKNNLDRVFENKLNLNTNQLIKFAKQQIVKIHFSKNKKNRKTKNVKYLDLELIKKINDEKLDLEYPQDKIPDGFNTRQPIRSHNFLQVNNFYTKRNLRALSILKNEIDNISDKTIRLFFYSIFTSFNPSLVSKLTRYNFGKRGSGPLTGTLYVPSFQVERNVIDIFEKKALDFLKMNLQRKIESHSIVSCQSATDLSNIPINSIDYIFTDPPFGSNLMYSELNFIWESWLKVFTNNKDEAIINSIQKKGLVEYQELMEQAFKENYRILKPGRWMTIVFHNSQNKVWMAIQEAIQRSGFIVTDVRVLDKKKGTTKQLVFTSGTVDKDLVISAYKPSGGLDEFFGGLTTGTEEGVWKFLDVHLKQLPVFVEKNDKVEVISERQKFLLFDRMVAFHIQKGLHVPISAAEFYEKLNQKYVERDGMYFLSEQIPEYDQKRAQIPSVEQSTIFVEDEKSTILWLNEQLKTPQTYQDIQPKFLQDIHQNKFEKLPELSEILEQNFLEDGDGKWYIPDPTKLKDLEKIREKDLLKEFQTYVESKGKLKQFRLESIRAGFKKKWSENDYKSIVDIAQRLPEQIIQEDSSLLMYYDNALSRL